MSNLCNEIENELSCLPEKDEKLCREFFKQREFEKILEIAKSDLIMKKKDAEKDVHKEKWEKIDVMALEELVIDLETYLSYMEIDVTQDEDYY